MLTYFIRKSMIKFQFLKSTYSTCGTIIEALEYNRATVEPKNYGSLSIRKKRRRKKIHAINFTKKTIFYFLLTTQYLGGFWSCQNGVPLRGATVANYTTSYSYIYKLFIFVFYIQLYAYKLLIFVYTYICTIQIELKNPICLGHP